MSTNEPYTPDDAAIELGYIIPSAVAAASSYDPEKRRAEYRRWLAAHDASVRAEAEAKGRAEVIDLFAHMSNEEFEWDGGLESLQERGWLPNEREDTNGS